MHIILDTDFGDDIDDAFALYYLLHQAKAQVSLVLSAFGRTRKRAGMLRSFLDRCGWADVPVGMGLEDPAYRDPYLYPFYTSVAGSGFYEDGLGKAKQIIEAYDDTVIVAIGPMTNLAALADICPKAKNVPVYAMFGSIYKGYFGADAPAREWNVFADLPAAQKFLASYRDLTLSPLDSCGLLQFEGDPYCRLLASSHPVMVEYRTWLGLGFHKDPDKSSVQYDVQPIYALLDGSRLVYETLPLVCDAEGYLRVSPRGNPVKCALSWRDRDGFMDTLQKIYL